MPGRRRRLGLRLGGVVGGGGGVLTPRRPPLELVPWLLLGAIVLAVASWVLGAFTASPDWLVLGLDAVAAVALAWAVWRVHGPK